MSAVDHFTPIPSRPAPVRMTGAVAWMKRNLFADWASTIATILIVGYLSDKIFRRAPLAGLGWIVAAGFLMGAALAPSPILSVVLMICALCAQQIGISCAEMLRTSGVSRLEPLVAKNGWLPRPRIPWPV